MKKLIIGLMVMMTCLMSNANTKSIAINSQDSVENKFLGKWDMLWKDLPDGDMECQLILTNENGKLKGTLTSTDIVNKYGKGIDLYDIDIDKKELSFMYTAEGYDVSIVVEMVDENSLEGYMMDMFEIFASRAKE